MAPVGSSLCHLCTIILHFFILILYSAVTGSTGTEVLYKRIYSVLGTKKPTQVQFSDVHVRH